METKKKTSSIIFQVAVFFLAGIIVTGVLIYLSQKKLSGDSVESQTEKHAAEIAYDAKQTLMEYQDAMWLIDYWYTHPDTMEVEYDIGFGENTATEKKCRLFYERHPDLQLRYMSISQCVSLPEEDQKLYAEIMYSWLISRINQIKRSYHVDFLFCVITEEPYDYQFFLFSGADEGAVRGTNYEEVYPLGNVVSVAESQTEAMRQAVSKSSHLADAGKYVDYYAYVCSLDKKDVLIGLTYSLPELREHAEAQTRNGAGLAIFNQFVLAVICLALTIVFVLQPLNDLQTITLRYKQTKESESAKAALAGINSHNEIERLAEDMSGMISEIDSHMEQIKSITAEKERIVTELSLAKRIQASMLPNRFPPFPERHEIDIYASMDPAKEVGGDFYDFFFIDEDHLCLVIADVSGKGVPAALFMMASKIILANNAMMGKSPAQILKDTNTAICANNQVEMFVTVWLGILEISTGKLTAANAGHEYPVLKKPGGSFELIKDRHGLVIGGMEGVKYREYELTLEPGAKLFVYTDGVPEATDADNKLFGTERMTAALNLDPDAEPEQLLKNVRAAVDGFVKDAEQFDDLTMLCVKYRGETNKSCRPH